MNPGKVCRARVSTIGSRPNSGVVIHLRRFVRHRREIGCRRSDAEIDAAVLTAEENQRPVGLDPAMSLLDLGHDQPMIPAVQHLLVPDAQQG